jgi:ATP-dependent DNA helicase RecG
MPARRARFRRTPCPRPAERLQRRPPRFVPYPEERPPAAACPVTTSEPPLPTGDDPSVEAAKGAQAGLDPGASVEELPGVGPARARGLKDAGLATLGDLCLHAPRALVEWPHPLEQGPLPEEGVARVRGAVVDARLLRIRGRQSSVTVRVRVAASGDEVRAVFWNQPWMKERFPAGREVDLAGPVHKGRSGLELLNPRVGSEEDPLPEPGSLLPDYDAPKGIGDATFAGWCRTAAERCADRMTELVPAALLARGDLPDLPTAVREAHAPRSRPAWEAARRRLALVGLLRLQAQLVARRAGLGGGGARAVRVDDALDRELRARLPYELTGDQSAAWRVLSRELGRRTPMRRLLQGDVGTGKTAVAALCASAVVEGGGQAAFLAPTEVLAEQHHMGLGKLLDAAGIGHALLTGKVKGEERREILRRLERGEIGVLFGTHALFQAGVAFARLDLAIIDEQHRFGVGQRSALLDKGKGVHLLLMTATPIPRTLALTLYADLEVVTLREAPPGRGKVSTHWVRGPKTRKVIPWLAERMAEGEQVYWVCPRIGSDGDDKPGAAEARYAKLASDERVREYGVELVHGRLPAEERSWRLERFRRGDIGLLVATTVIEVGVDVADATVIVIEGAERLGLAQLHQLRGRVGRGPRDSWCLLTGAAVAAERFELLERTRDGFEIAEEDLRRRGMGDLAGLRQAGANQEGLADPERDLDLVLLARELCQGDPELARRLGGGGPRLTP